MSRNLMWVFSLVTLILSVPRGAPADTVALWLFDGPPGASVALDTGAGGLHLTLGEAADLSGGGKFGNCLTNTAGQLSEIGGKAAYLENVDQTILNTALAGDFTIEGWFRLDAPPSGDLWCTLFRVGRTTGPWTEDTTALYYRPAFDVVIDGNGQSLAPASPENALVVGEWTHLALTHVVSTGQTVLFKSGQPIHQFTTTVAPDGFDSAGYPRLDLLTDPTDQRSTFVFPGSIDELRISNAVEYEGAFTPPGTFSSPTGFYLSVWPSELVFTNPVGDTDPIEKSFNIQTWGVSPPDWTLSEEIVWLSVSPADGGGGEISQPTVTVDPSQLDEGTHEGTITIEAPGALYSPGAVQVRVHVVGETMLDVGDRKQLFIDHRFIESSENVTLRMNQAQKLGKLFDSEDVPWEVGTGGYFQVLEDGGKYKMYYGSYTGDPVTKGLSYAESLDGLLWIKPPLGIIELDGHDTNIILRDDTIDGTVFVDPVDIPERRYKLFRCAPALDGIHASYSADGIHFAEVGKVGEFVETSIIAYWDERIGRYVVYTRKINNVSGRPRAVGRREVDDLLSPWPPSQLVLATDDLDDPYSDLYTNAAYIYPYAQDVYLMFPTVYRHFDPSRQPFYTPRYNNVGMNDVHLAISRDGVQWDRSIRGPYFPMGLPDEWDRWLNFMAVGMIRKGNYLYQYYWTTGMLHQVVYLREEYRDLIDPKPTIGAVRQRLDGFISADSDYSGGWLTTPPLIFSGKNLRLNIDTGAMGTTFVELRDINDQPIAGYTLQNCEEIGGNFVDTLVRWNGNADLSGLVGTPIKIHFKMRGTKLYAFGFARYGEGSDVGDWQSYQ